MSESESSTGVVPGVTGIIGLSLIFLVLGHYLLEVSLPGVGVVELPVGYSIVVLFVVSGFLVTTRIVGEFERTGDVAARSLWWRRLLRAYPTIVAFTAVTTLHQMIGGVEVPPLRIAAYLGMFGNYYNGLAEADANRHIIGHLWSISVGAHFLVVYVPVLVWALSTDRMRVLRRAMLALAAASLAWRTWLVGFTDVPQVYVYNATETRVDALAIGAFVALVFASDSGAALRERISKMRWTPLIVGVPLIASVFSPPDYVLGPGISVNAGLTALLLALVVSKEGQGVWGWLDSRALAWARPAGLSLFVWQFYGFIPDGVLSGFPLPVRAAAVFVTLGIVTFGGWLVWERPFRRVAARSGGAAVS